MLSSLLLMLSLWSSDARAAEITAGEVVLDGEIIRATSNVLTIKLTSGGIISAPRGDITTVVMEVPNVGRVEGAFIDWRDGLYLLGTASGDIQVSAEGVVTSAGSERISEEPSSDRIEQRPEPSPPSVTM